MGEYADMMLDGTLCEGCGAFIDDAGAEGFPRYCSNQCARDRGALHALPNPQPKPNPAKANCPTCGKRVTRAGLPDHHRDSHPEVSMPENRQFVAVKFRTSDTRTFTYTWDGEPLAEGDQVRVADRSGDGWKVVFVVSTTDEAPPFACKPILGRHVEEEPATPIEAAAARPADFHPNSPEAMLAARRGEDPLSAPLAF